MNRLNQKYNEVVVPNLMKKFNYKSVMEVPYVDKIVINMGIGEANLYDATNVRLRNVSLNYTFPRKMLAKGPFQQVKLGMSCNNAWHRPRIRVCYQYQCNRI